MQSLTTVTLAVYTYCMCCVRSHQRYETLEYEHRIQQGKKYVDCDQFDLEH